MSSAFPTTQWTLIYQASDAESRSGEEAFGALCQSYWQPLFAFTCGSGASHQDAQDLTQGFFQHLLEKALPANLHPTKGRFRNWLLASLKNFLASDHRNQTRQKRGGPDLVTLTLEDAHHELYHHDHPAQAYEREWARSVLANALTHLQVECQHARQIDRFEVLQGSLFDISKGEGATLEHATALGITHNAAKVALSRLRQRYRELVRKEVTRLVEDPAEVDEEIAHLVRVLSQ